MASNPPTDPVSAYPRLVSALRQLHNIAREMSTASYMDKEGVMHPALPPWVALLTLETDALLRELGELR